MYPILFESGDFFLPAWHTFYMLGAVAAFFLFREIVKRHIPEVKVQDATNIFIIAYLAGYFGARLLSVIIEEFDVTGPIATIAALFRLGPMTFYGGAIAVFLAGSIYVSVKRLPFWQLLDAGMPAGMVALGIGRIGCFLNGDDYGIAVPAPADGALPFWAVTFPSLKDGIPRYPIQLLEAGIAFLIAFLALKLFLHIRRQYGLGLIGLASISAYAVSRFFLEYWRGDSRGWVVPDLISTSQGISILILVAVGIGLPLWFKQQASAGQ